MIRKIIQNFANLDPVLQALLATTFTWFVTILGASLVFPFKNINQKMFDIMLGFSAGVMIAASYWSLLAPSIQISTEQNIISWLPAAVGFFLGSIFVYGIDKVLPHLHPDLPAHAIEGPKSKRSRSFLMVSAITIHNIPEGLAVGVAFGAAAIGISSGTSIEAAIALTVGIALQNFPEGIAVSMPLRGEGYSRVKSFWYGQLSAAVEPVAGVVGAMFVYSVQSLLPYTLAFAAGAMIFVVVEEVIPSSHRHGNVDLATISLIFGFILMMVLDTGLG